MFNFFKFKKSEPINEQKASITYLIDDTNTPMIDIVLNDYDEESINALCLLLDILSKDSSYVETIKMIQENLILNNREDLVIKILTHISSQQNSKITSFAKHSRDSQVYINPSDAMT